nr:hypothetical protein [Tanacetum cinerariifolium]
MLNDVRNALDDRLKGIWMQYLPTTIWRRGDKDRAAAMIQAIDKMLKTRRIMRSLEKFVGGRLGIVTHWFTLIVLSALRRSDNENMLSLVILILSFDQYHSSQSSVTPQLPQRSNKDVRLEMAKLIKNNRIHLNNNDFPHEETKPEEIPELMCKLLEDVQNIKEELAEYINSQITTVLPTEEPEHSLSMGYEHLSITPETDSNEVTESNAKNLLPIPSECEVTSENERKCDMPAKDDYSPAFTTFTNPLFNNNDDLDSSDNKSLPDEDVPTEEFKVYSNPLFDDDAINSDKLDPHCFNVESDRDTLTDSSSKFDFLLKEFFVKLTHINPEEADFDFEEEIHLIENLLYGNSSSRPPEEHNAEEERIKKERAEYISRMEMMFTINPRPRPTNDDEIDVEDEASNFDNPLFPRPPLEPPDDEFDLEPEVISVVMKNNDELNEDECFDPGGEIDVSTNDEDDDCFLFMFVIRSFLPYLIYHEWRWRTIFNQWIKGLERSCDEAGSFVGKRIYPSVIEVSSVRIFIPVRKIFTSFD